jgi:HEAT repeat protein
LRASLEAAHASSKTIFCLGWRKKNTGRQWGAPDPPRGGSTMNVSPDAPDEDDLEGGASLEKREGAGTPEADSQKAGSTPIGDLREAVQGREDDTAAVASPKSERRWYQLRRRTWAAAIVVLAAIGSGIGWWIGDPVGREILKLRYGPRSVRVSASTALGTLGATDARVVPALAAALKDEFQHVRAQAVWELRQMGPQAAKAVPALVEAVEKDELGVRGGAITCLGRIGPDAKGAIPALVAVKKHQDETAVLNTILALSRIDPTGHPGADEVYMLIQMLKTKVSSGPFYDGTVPGPFPERAEAARVLGEIGPRAKAAVPALVEYLNGKNQDIREPSGPEWRNRRSANSATIWASFALAKIDPADHSVDDAVATLVGLLSDQDSVVDSEAARALGLIGPEAEAAVPALIEALKDEREWGLVPCAAAVALGDIGPAARPAVSALKEMAENNKDASLRRVAARAMKRIRRDATDSEP